MSHAQKYFSIMRENELTRRALVKKEKASAVCWEEGRSWRLLKILIINKLKTQNDIRLLVEEEELQTGAVALYNENPLSAVEK